MISVSLSYTLSALVFLQLMQYLHEDFFLDRLILLMEKSLLEKFRNLSVELLMKSTGKKQRYLIRVWQ